MTPAIFFAVVISMFGGVAGVLFMMSSLRYKMFLSWRVLSLMTAGICLYCCGLWGGTLFGWWLVTPELGRPALAMALAALAWFGLLIPNAGYKNGD